MFEIAYTSFKIPAYKICVPWDGARKGRETGIKKIHPHQKPIALYQELMSIFAKQGDKILDTHLGSGSSRIVAYKLGFDFYACEIDEEYFQMQEKRFRNECLGEIETKDGLLIQQQLF